jgi:uncharacterized protein (TIGR00369 family)
MSETNPNVISPELKAMAEGVFNAMAFSQLIGMKLIDIVPNSAVVAVDMRDDLRQPSGILHGGITATLIDTAMSFAVRTRLGLTEATATIDLTVHYLRPHTEGRLTCTATIVRAGRRIFTVSAEAHNEEGKMIATGLSTYTKV